MRSGDSNAADYLMAVENITDALGREALERYAPESPASDNHASESRRPFVNDAKCLFQREPAETQRAFVKKSSDQRDAVRHAARRRELGKWFVRVRRPVTSRRGHLNKSRAQSERGMPREIENREDFVAQ